MLLSMYKTCYLSFRPVYSTIDYLPDILLTHRIQLPISGLFLPGGLLEDAPLQKQTAAALRRVVAPKVAGASAVLAATSAAPVATVALFSSIAALLGNAGQANYGAANGALDSIASRLQGQVGICVCVLQGG